MSGIGPISAAPPSCYEAFLTADATIVGDATYATGPQTTPAAGPYLVTANLIVYANTNSAAYYAARIYVGTTSYAEADISVPAGMGSNPYHFITVSARVTVDGATAIKAQVIGNQAGFIVASGWQSITNKASSIRALRISLA